MSLLLFRNQTFWFIYLLTEWLTYWLTDWLNKWLIIGDLEIADNTSHALTAIRRSTKVLSIEQDRSNGIFLKINS